MINEKKNLNGLSLLEMQTFVKELGEPLYRGRQLYRWLYGKGVRTFDEMTNLSTQLRGKLKGVACIGGLKPINILHSQKDSSVKYLFCLEDGLTIESVLMFDEKRATLCISTQVGCAIDCKFCATGMMGLKRNLTVAEIVEQFFSVQQLSGKTITNVVCMGMGEPFQNYDNLMNACGILTNVEGPNLSNRHIVVSTSGILPKIYQFTDEDRKYKLAISLNATNDESRSQLMPLNKKWPIRDLVKAVIYYTRKANQRVTFEYVLLSGMNDTPADAERLRQILQGIHCKLNLIPYNATFGVYKRPSKERVEAFYKSFESFDVPVTIRWSKGDDIKAGCGQLAGENL